MNIKGDAFGIDDFGQVVNQRSFANSCLSHQNYWQIRSKSEID
jgi:hypothetical protein